MCTFIIVYNSIDFLNIFFVQRNWKYKLNEIRNDFVSGNYSKFVWINIKSLNHQLSYHKASLLWAIGQQMFEFVVFDVKRTVKKLSGEILTIFQQLKWMLAVFFGTSWWWKDALEKNQTVFSHHTNDQSEYKFHHRNNMINFQIWFHFIPIHFFILLLLLRSHL